MTQQDKNEDALQKLAVQLRADAQAAGVELSVAEALEVTRLVVALALPSFATEDAVVAAEEERVLGLLDARHLAFDDEVTRLVAAA